MGILFVLLVFTSLFILAATSNAVAERVLHAKQHSFSNDLTKILDEVNSDSSLLKEPFDERKAHFEHNWEEIVYTTEGCNRLIEDEKDEHINKLN